MAFKGGGKGKGSLEGLPNSSIEGLPRAGVAVFKDSADKAVDFVERLREALAPHEAGQVHFENIDVSNVNWPLMSFSLLLDVLQDKSASTTRLKAFKAGLDDECAVYLAGWLEQLPAESLPSELHLSHNQMTQRGLDTLLDAIEAKRAELETMALPIWFRLESNKVDMQSSGPIAKALVEQGRAVLVAKIGDRAPSNASVALPSFANKGGGGKGKPAAAPAPAYMALGGGGGPAAAAAAAAAASWKGAWGPGNFMGGYNWWEQPAGNFKGGCYNWWEQPAGSWVQPTWQGKGGPRPTGRLQTSSAQAVDRSRTPAARTPAARAPAESGKSKLPPGWEEQWSEEYQIPYYWNNVTGESLWEPPK